MELYIKKIFLHWRSYRSRFRELNTFLRLLPVLIVLPVIMLSGMFQPSLIDRMYFSMLSQQSGLQAVSFYPTDSNLRFWSTGNHRTFAYNLSLRNHGDEYLNFHMVFLYQDREGSQEAYLIDENGDVKLLTLPPRQLIHFKGEFSDTLMFYGDSGGSSIFSVVLISDDDQHKPVRLVRPPLGL